jgi:hypothetical protein
LTNRGYRAKNPPADIDQARVDVVKEFIDLWATSLAAAGVPDEKIYSHTACMSQASFDARRFGQPEQLPGTYLQTINFTPPGAACGVHHRPGFSTYPQFGLLEQIQAELITKGAPPWASSEGTAVDPGAAEKGALGLSMETYLGNLFNRGAVLVNIFGWGVGPSSNPFRRIAESPSAIAAYQKFLHGDELRSDPPVQLPSPQFFDKMRQLQKQLPPYLATHNNEKVARSYEELSYALQAQYYHDAEQAVDQMLQTIKE